MNPYHLWLWYCPEHNNLRTGDSTTKKNYKGLHALFLVIMCKHVRNLSDVRFYTIQVFSGSCQGWWNLFPQLLTDPELWYTGPKESNDSEALLLQSAEPDLDLSFMLHHSPTLPNASLYHYYIIKLLKCWWISMVVMFFY